MALGDLLKTIALPENQPNLIRMDRLGNFWVTNFDGTNSHLECVTPAGSVIVNITLGTGTVGGLSVDKVNDFVYVSYGSGGSSYYKYNLSGTLLNTVYGGPGVGSVACNNAGDYAVVTVGNYVNYYNISNVSYFGGSFIEYYPTGGNSAGPIVDLVVHSSGDLFMVDQGNGCVTRAHKTDTQASDATYITITGASNISSIAIDSNGYIWVTDNGNGKMYKINPATNTVVATTTFAVSLDYLCTDSAKNVWSNGMYGGGVFYCYDTIGAALRFTGHPSYPQFKSVVCDSTNNLWGVSHAIGNGWLTEYQGYVAAPPPITKKNTLQIF